MSGGNPALVVTSAARTTSGSSSAIGCDGSVLSILLDCTAASGTTPSLVLSVEWSTDGGTTFCAAETPDAFTALTTTGKVCKQFRAKSNFYRLVWTITGTTPSFTFSAREYTTGA